jgi:hypothetical protein
VDIGLPELTEEQIEEACAAAETAARKHIFSKVSAKMVDNLDISVEAEGTKPVNLYVEVDLVLLPEAKGAQEKTLAEEAVAEAFKAIEKYLRKLK